MLSAGCTPTVVGDGDHGRSRLRRVSLQFAAGRGLNPRRNGAGRGLVIQKCHLTCTLRRAAEATTSFRADVAALQGAQARPSLRMVQVGRCLRQERRHFYHQRRAVGSTHGTMVTASCGNSKAKKIIIIGRGLGSSPHAKLLRWRCSRSRPGGILPFFLSRPCHPRPRRGRPRRAAAARRLRVENERLNSAPGCVGTAWALEATGRAVLRAPERPGG